MATKSIIFFTAGTIATIDELAKIEMLNDLAGRTYTVTVMRSDVKQGLPIRTANYVAGAVPLAYAGVEVVDPVTVTGLLDQLSNVHLARI